MKKLIIAMFLCLVVSGCANLKFQFSVSYATDNLLEDFKNEK